MSSEHLQVESTIGIDLGGTNLRVAIVAYDGLVVASRKTPTPDGGRPNSVVNSITALVSELRSAARGHSPASVGVAAPGPLDPITGVVHDTPNLEGWDDFPLADALRKALGLPVWVNNDANLAALGEARFGAGRGFDSLIYLTISTGVGGGIIIDRQIYSGSHGLAGELGHVIVQAGGPACNFGHPGCLEGLASGTALAKRAQEMLAEGRVSSIADGLPSDNVITSVAVAEAAAKGDELALSLFNDLGRALGYGVGSFVNAFDVAVVVIGGGVSQSWDLFYDSMVEASRDVIMSHDKRPLEIVPAELGDDAGLVGAAAYARDQIG